MAKPYFYVSFIIAINFISSLLVIFTNKYIYTNIGFPNLWLTCVHFIITYLGILLCHRLSLFNVKFIPIREVLLICLSFCGFVVLTNFSLQNNTVGTYQILKILTTPTIIVLQNVLYHKKFSKRIKISLIPIIIGIYTHSYFDIKFNGLGLIYGLSGVIVTSFYQIWAGEKQKEFQVNSLQLLYYLSPMSCIFLGTLALLSSPISQYFKTFVNKFNLTDMIIILLSGFFALIVNVSTYSLIKCTSALTYNMIGHMKFCFTLLLAYLLFHDPVQIYQLLGIASTMIGVLYYSYIKFREEKYAVTHLPIYTKK